MLSAGLTGHESKVTVRDKNWKPYEEEEKHELRNCELREKEEKKLEPQKR